jgi:hypothetical protein
VTTSEFNDVKTRLLALHNKRKVDAPQDPSKPQLRKNPGKGAGAPDDKGSSTNDDERPTLQRRPNTESNFR